MNVDLKTNQEEAEFRLPTRTEAALFRLKTAVFQVKHSVSPSHCVRFEKSEVHGARLIAESRTPLRSSDDSAERKLQSGKVQNLRVAAAFLDEIMISSDSVFSFWRHVPRPTRRFGFVEGRELREGCIVPSIGGGLCQLSNALYDCALRAGLEIVERHGHSKKVPGSLAEAGRDATIFWNYVDLKFRAAADWQLRAFLNRTELVVQIFAKERLGKPVELAEDALIPKKEVRSCETCGMTTCFRHPDTAEPQTTTNEFSAWAVDSFAPEFGEFISQNRCSGDWLFTPLSTSRNFARGKYPWPIEGFGKAVDFPSFVIRRSIVSRKLANQGAERQMANLKFNRTLAEKMIQKLPHRANHVVVSLELLPYFWESGVLGGRKFDVMMTRWPIRMLQQKLDLAAKQWPESPTLADFRADEKLAELEWEALQEADSWITPHSEIAKSAPDGKPRLLDWRVKLPEKSENAGRHIIFPTTTAGRNGAYEVREAMRQLGLPLKIIGPNVEGPDFWDGIDVERLSPESWLEEAAVIMLPAWISTRPSRLFEAIRSGIPIITTPETGISNLPGVTTIPVGDVSALVDALKSFRSDRVESLI